MSVCLCRRRDTDGICVCILHICISFSHKIWNRWMWKIVKSCKSSNGWAAIAAVSSIPTTTLKCSAPQNCENERWFYINKWCTPTAQIFIGQYISIYIFGVECFRWHLIGFFLEKNSIKHNRHTQKRHIEKIMYK